MSLTRDLRIVGQLIRGSRQSGDHSERMEQFYAEQAEDYDAFRERLLPGRKELLTKLPLPENAVVADLGGGTGANLEFLPAQAHQRISRWQVVDLSASLLSIAARRKAQHQWQHVDLVNEDAVSWAPTTPPDLVLFSYSLTMIPDWQAALEHALDILKPGGHLALVDFTVSGKRPAAPLARNSWFARNFWPRWFAWDGVYLNPNHLPWLLDRLDTKILEQSLTRLPFLPGSRVPYYWFIGQKN